jgi:hypothetical protein
MAALHHVQETMFLCFFCMCLCFTRSWGCSREQGSRSREVLEVLNGSWNMNTNKKQKTKKILKNFFISLCLCMCLCFTRSWWCSREQGSRSREVLEVLNGSWNIHNQKETKNKKNFKKFFVFFCMCLCFTRSWGCSREQGSRSREVLEVLNGSWNTNTNKKQKTKKILKNFFIFVFFACVCVSRGPEGARENRAQDPARSLKSWMVHETQTQTKNKKQKKF